MSKKTPDFLKNFLSIKTILNNDEKKIKFENKFKSLLKIEESEKEKILSLVEQIKDVEICAYVDNLNQYADKYKSCVENKILYINKFNGETFENIFDNNKVYYKLTNNKVSEFCENNYDVLEGNVYLWFHNRNLMTFNIGNVLYEKNTTDLTNKNKNKLLNGTNGNSGVLRNSTSGLNNIQESINFDTLYYNTIDNFYRQKEKSYDNNFRV